MKHNRIVRYETCSECSDRIPCWEYTDANGYIPINRDGVKTVLCCRCWNIMFERISHTVFGWTLVTDMEKMLNAVDPFVPVLNPAAPCWQWHVNYSRLGGAQ